MVCVSGAIFVAKTLHCWILTTVLYVSSSVPFKNYLEALDTGCATGIFVFSQQQTGFKMSLQLKHVPCPAGDRCAAYHCIFGHERDKVQAKSPDGNEQSNGYGATRPQEPEVEETQRKRPRLSSPSVPNSASGSTKLQRTSKAGTTPIPNTIHTANKSISPPPLTRQTPTSAKGTKGSTGKVSTTRLSQTAASPVSKVVNKTESLNPRLLKHSPASHELRMKLLKMLHAEYKRLNTALQQDTSPHDRKLSLSDSNLIMRALDEEEKCAIEKPSIYANVMKNKIMQHKRMGLSQWRDERFKETSSNKTKRNHDELDEQPVKLQTGLTAAQEVALLHDLLTPIDELGVHGYVPVVPLEEDIIRARDGVVAAMGWEKCERCAQRFQVFPGRRADGALTTGGPCRFHWGKTIFPARTPGDKTSPPKRFSCCNQELGESSGCITHPDHVFKASDPKRLASVLNFAKTPKNDVAPTDRAVCFDCEMGFTVYGLELIRLTATSWPTGELLIDVLVKPFGEILDLNSRFSGVLPEDLAQGEAWSAGDDPKPTKSCHDGGSENGEVRVKRKLKVVASPKVARDILFSQISPNTPLIGHGLENDLNAMRIVHPTLVDTVLLFPHKAGLPYRHGLKLLMDRHLHRKIQLETGPNMLGHDSAEDARAAGDLVRLRVMQLWQQKRLDGWKVVNGNIEDPAGNAADETLTEAFIEA